MSINSTIVHTWQAVVFTSDIPLTVKVQAKSKKEARAKLQRIHKTKNVNDLKRLS